MSSKIQKTLKQINKDLEQLTSYRKQLSDSIFRVDKELFLLWDERAELESQLHEQETNST